MINKNQKLKITLDSCILFDYLNPHRKNHVKAKKVIEDNRYELYITESVLKEIRIDTQLEEVKRLISSNVLIVLKEPGMGISIPVSIPMDLSHISAKRDASIALHLKKRPGLKKHKVLRDFLIAEAHQRNKNDYLLTTNTKDFIDNTDMIIKSYENL
ncbi:MAG: hypothetical protein WC775_02405 [Patescibacteria group bacterium]|jgi:PIN domain nuclease of toxin-antitoxin system